MMLSVEAEIIDKQIPLKPEAKGHQSWWTRMGRILLDGGTAREYRLTLAVCQREWVNRVVLPAATSAPLESTVS